jgi:hypothetical protein
LGVQRWTGKWEEWSGDVSVMGFHVFWGSISMVTGHRVEGSGMGGIDRHGGGVWVAGKAAKRRWLLTVEPCPERGYDIGDVRRELGFGGSPLCLTIEGARGGLPTGGGGGRDDERVEAARALLLSGSGRSPVGGGGGGASPLGMVTPTDGENGSRGRRGGCETRDGVAYMSHQM